MKRIIILLALLLLAAQVVAERASIFTIVELRNSGDIKKILVPSNCYRDTWELEKELRNWLTWERDKTAAWDRYLIEDCGREVGRLLVSININEILVYRKRIGKYTYLRFIASGYARNPPQPRCGQEYEYKCLWEPAGVVINFGHGWSSSRTPFNSWYAAKIDKHCPWIRSTHICFDYCYNGKCVPFSTETQPKPPQTAPQTSWNSRNAWNRTAFNSRNQANRTVSRRVLGRSSAPSTNYTFHPRTGAPTTRWVRT